MGTNRRYDVTGGAVSLDPAARFLRAPVVATGQLRVGGTTVDAATRDSRAAQVDDALRAGAPPGEVARLGVGWILLEATGAPAERSSRTLATLHTVYSGSVLTLYRVPDPTIVRASGSDRAVAWTAHLIWLATIAAGAAAFLGTRTGFVGAAVVRGRRLFQ